ncbi:MAG: MogA/MoaB family molybdenum cofactor biosynthesis protein [Candidatus Thermoplasmatota archaeon]|nr:MogA/MoaB family molybdenum cofactor biosynthesis protein [Candidatus Thermoplasmatota archaeon]
MHDHISPGEKARFSILTCSSTRVPDNDESGKTLQDILYNEGFQVVDKKIVKDDFTEIVSVVRKMIEKCDILLITGGTGITKYDVTIEAVRSISEKEMTGFMIQFQILSSKDVGMDAMLSGASGFVVERKAVFCLPGSPRGAFLGLKGIIIPEAPHIIHELRR